MKSLWPAAGEGVRWGLLLAVGAVIFGVLGLTPSLAWIPEVPLLAAGAAVPLVLLAFAGRRVGTRTGVAGALVAGAVAGAIGGLAGGISYVLYGKSPINVAAGLVAGALGGAAIAGICALLSRLSKRPTPVR
jgi:hypothetical protein